MQSRSAGCLGRLAPQVALRGVASPVSIRSDTHHPPPPHEDQVGLAQAQPGRQALLVLAYLRKGETFAELGGRVRRGHRHGPTVVEYGDFECPYCGEAEPVLRELLAGHGDVRYVWRHLPLTDVHPHALPSAEASEAAAEQGAFWPMHDLLLRRQDALLMPDLIRYATEVGIDPARFRAHLASRSGAARIAEDVDSADLSGVSGTPTFFINGRRALRQLRHRYAHRCRPGRQGRSPGRSRPGHPTAVTRPADSPGAGQ
jgi:predicted DsbA family dithiol-disulfide isomerase